GFGEPRFAIGNEPAANRPGHTDPFAADRGEDPLRLVISALRLADLFGHVGHINNAVRVELRPGTQQVDDVRARPGLDRCGSAGLEVVGVDHLDIELDAERLLALRRNLLLQQLIGSWYEI